MEMEGISKEELIRVKENMPDGTSKLFVHTLIRMCKELPDQQWQTIDEFKANPSYGLCFVSIGISRLIIDLFYRNTDFYVSGNSDIIFKSSDAITDVMPIKTPEAPK